MAHSDVCTGCGACASTCPVDCIRMVEDKEGFLQPKVDGKKCIGCHRCEKTCPILNKEPIKKGQTKAFAAINKDEAVRMRSSSGGVFHALAKWVVEQGGVVFGARFDEHWEVMHDYAETLEGVEAFMGSKYIQSRIGNTYKQAKTFLEDGRWVLFSGTPCQLGGLRAYLGKEYDRLVQVDLICHGVPSPKVWRSYLKENLKRGVVKTVSFRDKENGWKDSQNVLISATANTIRERQMDNLFFRGFIRNVYLRRSCYSCQFRSCHRNSDLTIADYWGVQDLCPEMFDDKGTSLVFSHTRLGNEMIQQKGSGVVYMEQALDDAVRYNPSMESDVPKDNRRRWFFRLFAFMPFNKAAKVIDKDGFVTRLKRKVKKLVKYFCYA